MARQKTLDDPASRQSINARISKLNPDSPRRWGKMSSHQMLCHLADSYRGVIGEREVSPRKMPIPRPLLRWLILNAPWPKNAPTRPEVDQLVSGTALTEFEADRVGLLDAIDRFCAAPDSLRTRHPILGNLDHKDWMRWGYLHADHHLRQFGV
jgi:hypothetical protein